MNTQEIFNYLQEKKVPGVTELLDPHRASFADPKNAPERKAEKKGEAPPPPHGDEHVYVDPQSIISICRFLRDDPKLHFELLISIAGCDYSKDAEIFGMVYHLLSIKHKHRVTLRADIPKASPEIDTVETVWPAANWHERETYDFYGIIFKGHSDLRRILLGEDWVGYPMRKDYVFPTEYHGISCV